MEITRDPALCAEVTLQPVRRLGVDAAIIFADITTPLAGLGVEYRLEDGVGPVVGRPIRSAADVAALRPFEPRADVPGLLEAIRLVREASPVPLIGFAGAPFTLACYLVEGRPSRDFVRVKRLLHADPPLFAALMERLVEMTADYLAAQVAAGAQAVQVFDSWVGGLEPVRLPGRGPAAHAPAVRASRGPRRADDPLRDRHRGDARRSRGGRRRRDRRRLADRRSPMHGRRCPDRGIQGNLDPALLLGPFDGVAEQARWILDQAGGRPGHIFNLGHGVLPETDPDDLRRLVDLVHEETRAAEPPTPSLQGTTA